MNYSSLLEYIRENPDQMKLHIWSHIKLCLENGDYVHQALPRTDLEFDKQFLSLIQMGSIVETKGKWRAAVVRRPPGSKQEKMF